MRTILFVASMAAFLATACTNSTPSATSTDSTAKQPEAADSQPNADQQGNAFSISTDAYYQANLRPTSSPEQVISLSLNPKGEAKMVTDYADKSRSMVDTGEWTTLNNGNLLLNLRRVGEKESLRLEFKTDGEKLVYTGSEYGATGLTMWVKPVPGSK
ncbi:MAG: hypothetical protein ACKVUS_06360 [Saprospiraceae bacterium]